MLGLERSGQFIAKITLQYHPPPPMVGVIPIESFQPILPLVIGTAELLRKEIHHYIRF